MPEIRKHREFTEKQKAALQTRHHSQVLVNNHIPVVHKASSKSLDNQLSDFLEDYNVRLMRIDQRYPLGNPDRPEWIEAHRRNGIERIKEIIQLRGKSQ